MWPNPQFPVVTFTEETLNEKLHFLCSVKCLIGFWIRLWNTIELDKKIYRTLFLKIKTENYENFSIIKVVEWRMAPDFYKRKNLMLHSPKLKLFVLLYFQISFFHYKGGLYPKKYCVEFWILFGKLVDCVKHHHSNQIYHQSY